MAFLVLHTSIAFLSTLPARGATQRTLYQWQPIIISIHAPREGSDERPAKAGQF